MDKNRIIKILIEHEGIVESAYQDHLGYWTIGVGRLIDARKGGKLYPDEINYLLNNDINRCIEQLKTSLPYFNELTNNQQMGLVNMCFQLGINGLLKFTQLLSAIHTNNKIKIREEAMDSKWYKQTPKRAEDVIALLLS